MVVECWDTKLSWALRRVGVPLPPGSAQRLDLRQPSSGGAVVISWHPSHSEHALHISHNSEWRACEGSGGKLCPEMWAHLQGKMPFEWDDGMTALINDQVTPPVAPLLKVTRMSCSWQIQHQRHLGACEKSWPSLMLTSCHTWCIRRSLAYGVGLEHSSCLTPNTAPENLGFQWTEILTKMQAEQWTDSLNLSTDWWALSPSLRTSFPVSSPTPPLREQSAYSLRQFHSPNTIIPMNS